MLHEPRNKYCDACWKGQVIRRKTYRIAWPRERPKKFGDEVACDHVTSTDPRMAGLRCGGRNAKGCLIMYDRATGYVDAKLIGSKEAREI